MKIKTISYKRTKNLGNHENEVLELTAELEDWENPEQAAMALKKQVADRLGIGDLVRTLEEERENLVHEINRLEGQIALAHPNKPLGGKLIDSQSQKRLYAQTPRW